MNASVEIFKRSVEERFSTLKATMQALLEAFVAEDQDAKVASAARVIADLEALKELLTPHDRPSWMSQLEKVSKQYLASSQTSGSAGHYMRALIGLWTPVFGHQWTFDQPSEKSLDFDEVYREYFAQSKAAELFNELVSKLQQLIDSGAVDSVKALDALKTLLATIKKNMRPSYGANLTAVHITTVFLKNIGTEYLDDAPIVGPLIRGIKKAVEELRRELAGVQEHVEAKALEHVPQGPLAIEFKKEVKELPKPELVGDG